MPDPGEARAQQSARRALNGSAGDGNGESRPPRSRTSRSVSLSPPLLRGRVRLALIRDLALGEWEEKTLAQKLGSSAADVRRFAEAHDTEISEVRQALAGRLALETAGMWITKKQNRIAELEALWADYDIVLNHMRDLPLKDAAGLGSRRHFNTTRAQLAILGAVADETEPRRGQPTNQEDRKVVHYVIEGLDPESLT